MEEDREKLEKIYLQLNEEENTVSKKIVPISFS